jgi:hypothetical protein
MGCMSSLPPLHFPAFPTLTKVIRDKVTLKTVVDVISTLAIERYLIQKLPSILSSEIVCDLTDEEVERIAAESSESAVKREQAREKLAVLENAMAELKRLRMHNALQDAGPTV